VIDLQRTGGVAFDVAFSVWTQLTVLTGKEECTPERTAIGHAHGSASSGAKACNLTAMAPLECNHFGEERAPCTASQEAGAKNSLALLECKHFGEERAPYTAKSGRRRSPRSNSVAWRRWCSTLSDRRPARARTCDRYRCSRCRVGIQSNPRPASAFVCVCVCVRRGGGGSWGALVRINCRNKFVRPELCYESTCSSMAL
jgi:hypothetical protein